MTVPRRYVNRQFRFQPDELAALKARSEKLGISEAELVRRAVRLYLGLRPEP